MTNQREIIFRMQQKWWKQLFSIHELTKHSKAHPPWSNTQLENAQELAMQERRGCPAPLRIGPRNGHNDAVGSGLLITDGENYGILTAGHVANKALVDETPEHPIWGVIVSPPHGGGTTRRAVPGGARFDFREQIPAIGIGIAAITFRMPESNQGRSDIGLALLDTETVLSAADELEMEAINLTDTGVLAQDPFTNINVAIGTPMVCDGVHKENQPSPVACTITPCRRYNAGGFNYIGYGVNEETSWRYLDWRGYSGGPIWAVQPTTGRPQLVGMVCSWDADETPEDRQRRAIKKLTGFRHEMFAHQIDSWFAQVATEMLTDVAHGRTHENRQGQTLIRTIFHPI